METKHVPPIRSQRQRRVLLALLDSPKTREQLDRIAGSSNSPDVVLKMRRRFGLELPCMLEKVQDRDGRSVERGIYSLTDTDARTVRCLIEWEVQHDNPPPQAQRQGV